MRTSERPTSATSRPWACAALAIVCSRATADDPAAASGRLELANASESVGIGPVVDAFVPRYFAPDVYANRPELVERARTIASATDPRGAAAMLRGMAARVTSTDLFDEITVPVSVIAGRHDRFVDVSELQRIADGVRSANLHVFNCGHLPQWETPADLNTALDGLLQQL